MSASASRPTSTPAPEVGPRWHVNVAPRARPSRVLPRAWTVGPALVGAAALVAGALITPWLGAGIITIALGVPLYRAHQLAKYAEWVPFEDRRNLKWTVRFAQVLAIPYAFWALSALAISTNMDTLSKAEHFLVVVFYFCLLGLPFAAVGLLAIYKAEYAERGLDPRRVSISRALRSVGRAVGGAKRQGAKQPKSSRQPISDPMAWIRSMCAESGAGIFLGQNDETGPVFADGGHAVLVLGPPRSGKSTGIVIPAILSAPGAVVSTSVKDDVMAVTIGARARLGRCWVFDPTGHAGCPPEAEQLRWSPLVPARTWEGSLRVAAALVGAAGSSDLKHSAFFSQQAEKLVAPLLFATSAGGRGIRDLTQWINRQTLTEALQILADLDDPEASIAFGELEQFIEAPADQRSGVFATASNAFLPYRSAAAIDTASDPNFDVDAFIAGSAEESQTIYVPPATDDVALVAPIVVALLDEIRRATFRAHAGGFLKVPVLFALDEVANIAPIPQLPSIISQAGGQGLHLLACLQDLSQAEVRWGEAGRGFLSLFGVNLVLRGIRHRETIETVSTIVGDYDRETVSESRSSSNDGLTFGETRSTSRERILSPADVSNGREGEVLSLSAGGRHTYLRLAHWFENPPWWHIVNGVACPGAPRGWKANGTRNDQRS